MDGVSLDVYVSVIRLLKGLLAGLVLVWILKRVKKLIALQGSDVARDFAGYAFWILAAFAYVALYLGYVRHTMLASRFWGVLAFYVGMSAAFAITAGLGGWITSRFKRARPPQPSLDSTAVSEPTHPRRVLPRPLRPLMSASFLSWLALLIWLVSLALPVFIDDKPQDTLYGGQILLRGWMGPLVGQFAWYANPLFVICFFRLQESYSSTSLAIIASLISLNTLTFGPSLGGSGHFYGYGWGYVLWFLSLALMLAAAGALQLDRAERVTVENGGWPRPVGLLLSALIVSGAVIVSLYDHHGANSAERVRMAETAIKRGPVCRVELAQVTQPLVSAAGPIEVRIEQPLSKGGSNEVEGLYNLLQWGIPVLRIKGRDYFYIHDGAQALLTSVPAREAAIATVTFRKEGDTIDMHIVAADGHQIVRQSWRKPDPGSQFCPDYQSMPSATLQPRALFNEAVGLTIAKDPTSPRSGEPQTRFKGEVIDTSRFAPSSLPRVVNGQCGDGVGWRDQGEFPATIRRFRSTGFQVGSQMYFPEWIYRAKALCQGNVVFLYSDAANTKSHVLSLEKRRLPDFGLLGSSTLEISAPDLTGDELGLDRVIEADGSYVVEVSSLKQGVRLRVKPTLGL